MSETDRSRELHAAKIEPIWLHFDGDAFALVAWVSVLALWFVATGSGWPFFLVMGWVWA